jgi:hypothetical protein
MRIKPSESRYKQSRDLQSEVAQEPRKLTQEEYVDSAYCSFVSGYLFSGSILQPNQLGDVFY